MNPGASSTSGEGRLSSRPSRTSRSELAERARADLALELARRGLPLRVDIVGAAEIPELDVRQESSAGGDALQLRLALTSEPLEVQVPRLVEQVLGKGRTISWTALPASISSAPVLWCAPG